MARSDLPTIETKEPIKRLIVKVPESLHKDVTKFCEFYHAETGTKPDESSLVKAILQGYFADHAKFQKFLKELRPAAPKKQKPETI